MRVSILKSHIHAGGVLEAGKDYDLPEAVARQKIAQGKGIAAMDSEPAAAGLPPQARARRGRPAGDVPVRTTEGEAESHDPPRPEGEGKNE